MSMTINDIQVGDLLIVRDDLEEMGVYGELIYIYEMYRALPVKVKVIKDDLNAQGKWVKGVIIEDDIHQLLYSAEMFKDKI
jgi:hypothetical protein